MTLGDEKSSISSFIRIPVCSEIHPAPNLRDEMQEIFKNVCADWFVLYRPHFKLTVEVTETAIPLPSRTDMWAGPWSS
jgi:hypothetical protein